MLRKAAELEPILFLQPHYPKGAGQDLIEHLALFWLAISCGYVLIIDRFEEYSREVDRILRLYVAWHPGVPAMHLDIVHGVLIMKHFYPVPLAWLSEEALESHNKLEKRFRQTATMKISRKRIMEDLFHRSMDGSDPLVLEYSLVDRLAFRPKRGDLPKIIHDMVDWQHPYNQA